MSLPACVALMYASIVDIYKKRVSFNIQVKGGGIEMRFIALYGRCIQVYMSSILAYPEIWLSVPQL